MRGLLFTVLTSAVLPLGTTLAQTQAEQPPSPQTQQPATPPQAQQGGQQPIAQQCLNDPRNGG